MDDTPATVEAMNWPRSVGPGRDSLPPVAALLVEWQRTANHTVFAALVAQVRSELGQAVAGMLRSWHIRDPDAVDDALSLVFDHLRRLAGASPLENRVTKFSLARCGWSGPPATDPGLIYLRHLARARAIDIARRHRRGRCIVLSELGADRRARCEPAAVEASCEHAKALLCDSLRDAADHLEPRQQAVIALLLEGKSQATIAHVLGVNEGTVSRMRSRAIDAIRRRLRDEAGHGAP